MRKSLLLINPLLIGIILSIGHCPKSAVNETEKGTESKDSLSNAPISSVNDSIPMYNDSAAIKHVGRDTTKPIRIEHGSDNQAKLDSIKNAKKKRKN